MILHLAEFTHYKGKFLIFPNIKAILKIKQNKNCINNIMSLLWYSINTIIKNIDYISVFVSVINYYLTLKIIPYIKYLYRFIND